MCAIPSLKSSRSLSHLLMSSCEPFSHTSGNTADVYHLLYVYICTGKRTRMVISSIFSKNNGFVHVKYTLNVVISQKRCQIDALLLETTNRK